MKKTFILLCLIGVIAGNMKAETVVADFGTNGVNPSYSNNGGCSSLTIADNPETAGINPTAKALKAVSASGSQDWWKGVEIDIQDVTISANTRYLHIMMNTNIVKFEYDVHTNADNWAGSSENHPKDNTWFDYILDLNALKGTTDLSGKTATTLRIAFNCDGSANRSKTVYIDEIVLTSDNTPRTETYTLATTDILLGDYESAGVIPPFSNTGTCASLYIAENPDNTCLNTTSKVLYAKTTNSSTDGGDWWKGIEIDIQDVSVSADTRYLHILMNTDIPKFEWDAHTDGDKWVGSSENHPQDNTWFDYVLDLTELKKGTNDQFSLLNKTITKLRIAFSCNETANRNKTVYIDEIVFNNNAAARECTQTGLIALPKAEQAIATRYYNLQGMEIAHPVRNTIYIVKKIYGNNQSETTKILFK